MLIKAALPLGSLLLILLIAALILSSLYPISLMLVTAGDIITFSSSSWAVVESPVSCKTENVMSPKRNTCLQGISRLNK